VRTISAEALVRGEKGRKYGKEGRKDEGAYKRGGELIGKNQSSRDGWQIPITSPGKTA